MRNNYLLSKRAIRFFIRVLLN